MDEHHRRRDQDWREHLQRRAGRRSHSRTRVSLPDRHHSRHWNRPRGRKDRRITMGPETEYGLVPLTRGYIAVVDWDDHGRISRNKWFAQPTSTNSIYAKRN